MSLQPCALTGQRGQPTGIEHQGSCGLSRLSCWLTHVTELMVGPLHGGSSFYLRNGAEFHLELTQVVVEGLDLARRSISSRSAAAASRDTLRPDALASTGRSSGTVMLTWVMRIHAPPECGVSANFELGHER